VRAKTIAAVLALVAILGVALPCGASAQGPKDRTFKLRPEVFESFSVNGTHGYSFSVKLRDRNTLEIEASKLAKGLAVKSADYTVPYHQAPGSEQISARIGRLGRIDVHFVPEYTSKEPPFLPECEGAKTVIEEGFFVGSIDFRGERDFTRVRAHHAHGAVTKSPELTCRNEPLPKKGEKATEKVRERESSEAGKEEEKEEAGSGTQAVGLKVKADGDRVGFEAIVLRFWTKKKSTAIIGFEASASRRLGRIEEKSAAGSIFVRGKSFVFPDPQHLTQEAVIRPGPPFTGAATFRRDDEGKTTWTGDLSVELPGYGTVHLAGKGTHAAICELEGCDH
jgi:hypothetical protein